MQRNIMFGLWVGLAALGCRQEKEPLVRSASLERFSSCDDMRSHIEDAWVTQFVYSHYGYGWYGLATDDVAEEGSMDGSADGSSGGPSDYSTTNNQEVGVDEADAVKTDGQYLYILEDQQLRVVQSWPVEETQERAVLSLSTYPTSMFLRNQQLIIFGQDYSDIFYDEDAGWYSGGTTVTVVDVSNPESPMVLQERVLEGYLVGARMIDDDIYLALQDSAWYHYAIWQNIHNAGVELEWFDWWSATPEAREAMFAQAAEQVRPFVATVLETVSNTQLLPRVAENGTTQPLLDCQDLYHPGVLSSSSTLSLVHMGADGVLDATGVMSEGWTPYVSPESFYVAQTSWWWTLDEQDVSTRIHRFALSGAQTDYAGTGQVPGWILNQFSMSEHDGHLRVASSDSGWWGEESPANNVSVLAVGGDQLEMVGEITGIAPGERIYAARFAGERGYLVTFQQVDPLFTLDLSDPMNPMVAGELKIPGYSSYLHPVGDDHILAVGMDGTDSGEITGLAVSLFDISDFSQPVLQDKLTLESEDWSWSDALYDHHAFTYHNNTLSIPAYIWSNNTGASGMLVVDVDLSGGLTELGMVDHADLVADSICYYGHGCDSYYWYAWMRRSVVVEDTLFSISNYGVKATAHREPATEQGRVLFYPAD